MTLPTYRPSSPTSLVPPIPRYEAAEAYARVRPDLDALPAEAVGRITANLAVVLSIALGALVHIEALMPVIATLPLLDVVTLRKLRDYAYALYYVDLLGMLAAQSAADVLDSRRVGIGQGLVDCVRALERWPSRGAHVERDLYVEAPRRARVDIEPVDLPAAGRRDGRDAVRNGRALRGRGLDDRALPEVAGPRPGQEDEEGGRWRQLGAGRGGDQGVRGRTGRERARRSEKERGCRRHAEAGRGRSKQEGGQGHAEGELSHQGRFRRASGADGLRALTNGV